MKSLIKFGLSLFDYFTEKKVFNELKKQIFNKKILVIDIGAHKGEYISNITKNFDIYKAYCFEPNPKVFQILKNNISSNSKIDLINYGVSNSSGEVIFNENIESSSSSLNELNTNSNYYKKKYLLLNFFNSKNVINKIKVYVITLDEFITKNKINKIDLLKIDTEGYEFQVLQGLKDKLKNVHLVHFEHHFDDMIIKEYKLTDIHNLLISNGFEKKFKIKMKFRKSFEYLYENKMNSL